MFSKLRRFLTKNKQVTKTLDFEFQPDFFFPAHIIFFPPKYQFPIFFAFVLGDIQSKLIEGISVTIHKKPQFELIQLND